MQTRSALLLIAVLTPLACHAQNTDPISADRPGISTTTGVLGKDAVQLESGLTYTWAKGAYSLGAPDLLVRKGLGDNRELRIGLPGYRSVRAGGATTTGWGDGYLGAKFGLGKQSGTDLALVLGFGVPSKDANFSTRTVDPDIQLAWSRPLQGSTTVGGFLHATYTNGATGRTWVGQGTLYLARPVSSSCSAFIEFAQNVAEGAAPDQVIDFGGAHLLDKNTQLDVSFGWHLDSADRRPFLAVGYSKKI